MSLFKTNSGFSIKIIGFQLINRGFYKGLPLYESVGGEVTVISLVKEPALDHGAVANEEERMVTGAVMIPDLKIYRNDVNVNGSLMEYYVYFSAETIKRLQENFKGRAKIDH